MQTVIWKNHQGQKMENSSIVAWMVKTDEIPARLLQVGRTQAELARHLKLDPSSLTKLVKGKRQLKATENLAIEAFFELAETGVTFEDHPQVDSPRRTGNGPRRLPVYGIAAAGGDGRVMMGNGRIIDWIDAPAFWSGAGELMGIRYPGARMEPRLFQGETVVAQIGLPPQSSHDCVLQFPDDTALVATFISEKDGVVTVRQWNPREDLKFERIGLKAVHAVAWRR